MGFFSRRPTGRAAEPEWVHPRVIMKLTKAQANGQDAVFHGQCRTCLNLKGNSSGEGMRYCVGCAISDWSTFRENRYMPTAETEHG